MRRTAGGAARYTTEGVSLSRSRLGVDVIKNKFRDYAPGAPVPFNGLRKKKYNTGK